MPEYIKEQKKFYDITEEFLDRKIQEIFNKFKQAEWIKSYRMNSTKFKKKQLNRDKKIKLLSSLLKDSRFP